MLNLNGLHAVISEKIVKLSLSESLSQCVNEVVL
jgi:hypothetical protein